MPVIDILVLLGIVAGTALMVALLRREGLRGRALAGAGWLGFSGVVLTVTMTAHCGDVLSRWHAGAGHDGTPWSYGFRIYSLLLLGGLLAHRGMHLLGAALRMGSGDAARAAAAMEGARGSSVFVLLLVVPLLPVHTVFAMPLTVIAAGNLVVLRRLARAAAARPSYREPPLGSALPAQHAPHA